MDHNITWTPAGVARYNTSNPLLVELGDVIVFKCQRTGAFTYSNMWIHRYKVQYDQCNCLAVLGESCDPLEFRNGYCSPGIPSPKIKINRNDAELKNVFNFNPGVRYYIVSHTSEQTLNGSVSDVSTGGQCLQGLRLVVDVQELPTRGTIPEIATTESPLVSGPGNSVNGGPGNSVNGGTEVTSPFSGGSGSNSSGQYSGTTDGNTTLTGIGILPARTIQDWHIALIAVLGTLLLLLVVVFLVAGAYLASKRMRSKTVNINPEGTGQECNGDTIVRGNDLYPDKVFQDPLN